MVREYRQLESGLKDLLSGTRASHGLAGRFRDALFTELEGDERTIARSSKNFDIQFGRRGRGNDDRRQGNRFSNVIVGGLGDDIINGRAGNDIILGRAGNDRIRGGAGRDFLLGGLGNDRVRGGRGNDHLSGGLGDDTIFGGRGNDVITYVDGDGNDIVSGGPGQDLLKIIGSLTQGDNFTLGKATGSNAVFQRTGLDNQPSADTRFTLTINTTEILDVQGGGGNDTFQISDLTNTGVKRVVFDGGDGDDVFDASASSVRVTVQGGAGADILTGGQRGDILTGGDGVDTLTGGGGRDRFVYDGNPFANGAAAVNAATGIRVLNQPDRIIDYTTGTDVFALGRDALNIDDIEFVEGTSGSIGNGNIINLTDGFANAAAAAKAIANNEAVTAEAGAFLYFNTTLGISRLVYSTNLAEGGDISVLANLNNQTVLANQGNFGANDFMLV